MLPLTQTEKETIRKALEGCGLKLGHQQLAAAK
jgi:hypothetical protein